MDERSTETTIWKRGGLWSCIVMSALFCVSIFLLYPESHAVTPAGAQTFIFANNYFSITFLLSAIEGRMPLYYLPAHFLVFTGKASDLHILQLISPLLLSAAFFACLKIVGLFTADAENEKSYSKSSWIIRGVSAALLIIIFLPAAKAYVLSADPAPLGLCLAAFSMLFFLFVFAFGAEKYSKLYFIFTILALYTVRFALPLYLSQASILFILKYRRRGKVSAAGLKAFLKVFLYFIPGLLIWLKAFTGVGAGLSPGILLPEPEAAIGSIQTAVAVEMFIGLALISGVVMLLRPGRGGGRIVAGVVLFVFATVVLGALTTFQVAAISLRRESNDAVASVFAAETSTKFKQSDSYVFMDAALNADTSLIEHYLHDAGINKSVKRVPGGKSDALLLDLGPHFRGLNEAAAVKDELFNLKEAFLMGKRVWVFNNCSMREPRDCEPELLKGRIKDTGKKAMLERISAWLAAHARMVDAASSAGGVNARAYRLKDAGYKDALLFDLFVNSYFDYEKAAKLIMSDDFATGTAQIALSGYDRDKEAGIIDALIKGCDGDDSCVTYIQSMSQELSGDNE